MTLDITARDIQAEAKKKGHPWSLAKGMDGFCPISSVKPKGEVQDPENRRISLSVNDEIKQDSNTNMMIFDIETTIAYISRWMTLEVGDIILTGTPEGVAPITSGDRLHGTIEGIGEVKIVVK